MNVFTAIATGLAMGVVFGFMLEKSRVFEPGMIVGQMQLRNFTMLKIFLAAVATGQHNQEGAILRFVFWHSLLLAILMGILVMIQAYLWPGIIPI